MVYDALQGLESLTPLERAQFDSITNERLARVYLESRMSRPAFFRRYNEAKDLVDRMTDSRRIEFLRNHPVKHGLGINDFSFIDNIVYALACERSKDREIVGAAIFASSGF